MEIKVFPGADSDEFCVGYQMIQQETVWMHVDEDTEEFEDHLPCVSFATVSCQFCCTTENVSNIVVS